MRDNKKNRNRRKLYYIIGAEVLLLALVLVLLFTVFSKPDTLEIRMTGDANLVLEYGQPYQEPGVQALYNGQPISVETEGQVDTGTLGTYELKYTAQKNGLVSTAIRTVTVQDTTAPVITLHTKADYIIYPGDPYTEEGFIAEDNHDGDLTDQVQREEKDGFVIYTVTDQAGNQATATRKILYYDPVPPVITLNGEKYMAVRVGETFADPGVTAIDDMDGDITDAVRINGELNTDQPGVYVLEYVSADAYGNEATTSRTVCVLSSDNSPIVEPNGKTIYLTFDDGPSSHTGRLLDVLAKYDVKVTFFVVETSDIEMISRSASEGHTVGIHSTSHRFEKIYATDEAFYNDLYTMQGIIERYTGQRTTILRFPGGSSNSATKYYNTGIMTRLTKSVQENGFQYFDWNVDSMDAGTATTAQEVFDYVTKGVSNYKNSVVLQHDTMPYSVDAVEQIVLWGIANGYTFAPITSGSPGCHHAVFN